jgi:hypothetical protein
VGRENHDPLEIAVEEPCSVSQHVTFYTEMGFRKHKLTEGEKKKPTPDTQTV